MTRHDSPEATLPDEGALFVDTNVLIYANIVESPFHAAALAALRQARAAGRALWISRQVLREYLVALTRPQSFAMVDRVTVLEQVRLFTEHFEVADDTTMVTAQLLTLLTELPGGGKQVHDANIVATMLAFDIPTLLTQNIGDFRRFDQRIRIETLP
jgi:predicted nucleic acid-binding protein